MQPRARISLWAIVVPVALLLIAYIVFAVATYRAPPSPPPPPPTPTPAPTATSLPTSTPAPATSTSAPSAASVTGAWTGTLTEPGGPFTSYTFSMNLTQTASGAVSGTAQAAVANRPQYYVVQSITGQVSGRSFTFQRIQTLQSTPPGQQWCIDGGQLTLSPDGTTLNGTWTGAGCGSGPIALTRA